MTAQIGEKLRYQGKDMPMYDEPLEQYFSLSGARPEFTKSCTGLWRGYRGSWEIKASRLYLVGISGTLKDKSNVTLETLFPEFSNVVFANWFNGHIRIPKGNLLEYVHMGYASKHEKYLFLEFNKGVLISTVEKLNYNDEVYG